VIKSPGARLWAVVGVCAIASVAVALKAHRRSAEGPALIEPGASGRSALQDPRQGSLTFDARMRNDIPYPLRPSLTSPDERGG